MKRHKATLHVTSPDNHRILNLDVKPGETAERFLRRAFEDGDISETEHKGLLLIDNMRLRPQSAVIHPGTTVVLALN